MTTLYIQLQLESLRRYIYIWTICILVRFKYLYPVKKVKLPQSVRILVFHNHIEKTYANSSIHAIIHMIKNTKVMSILCTISGIVLGVELLFVLFFIDKCLYQIYVIFIAITNPYTAIFCCTITQDAHNNTPDSCNLKMVNP